MRVRADTNHDVALGRHAAEFPSSDRRGDHRVVVPSSRSRGVAMAGKVGNRPRTGRGRSPLGATTMITKFMEQYDAHDAHSEINATMASIVAVGFSRWT